MILQTLFQYAQEEKLVESMEVKERFVHLVLSLRNDGTVSEAAPWQVLTPEVENPKTKAFRPEFGRAIKMPEFPGVKRSSRFLRVLGDIANKGSLVLGLQTDILHLRKEPLKTMLTLPDCRLAVSEAHQ